MVCDLVFNRFRHCLLTNTLTLIEQMDADHILEHAICIQESVRDSHETNATDDVILGEIDNLKC